MTLSDHFKRSGDWLFRWRSYVPLVAIVVMLLSARQWGDEDRLPTVLDTALEALAILVSAAGLAIRAYTVGCTPRDTSGRNTRTQVAVSLNTTGIYSVVRHPLYVGNYLMGLGVSILTFTWWLPVLYSLFFWIYYERIMFAEEAFLDRQFGAEFAEWAARTPAFVPRLSLFRRSALPFSLRNVLRREYNGAYAVVLMFVVFDAVGDVVSRHLLPLDHEHLYTLAAATLGWLALRGIKRHTQWLDVAGR